MQQSTYYQLSEPEYGENPDVALINGNMDIIDTALDKARKRDTDLYNENTSYTIGDFCIYNDGLYKCIGATTGAWDNTKWTQTTIADAFEPKGTWELFETITADGTANYYESDLPENVSGIYVVLAEAAGQTQNEGSVAVTVNFETESASTYRQMSYFGNMITNGARYAVCEIEIDGNRCKPSYSSVATTVSASTSVYWRNEYTHFNKGKIKKLRIVTSSSTIYHPSGSTFEIYVRR